MINDKPNSLSDPASDNSKRPERRVSQSDRRKFVDRRSNEERRCDNRLAPPRQHKSIKLWLRSLVNARLGVDRRKRTDRRLNKDRRQLHLESLLTREEIADLFAE